MKTDPNYRAFGGRGGKSIYPVLAEVVATIHIQDAKIKELVEALESIPERCGTGSEAAQIAREALAKWKGEK